MIMEFEYQDESYKNAISGFYILSSSRCEEKNRRSNFRVAVFKLI